MYAVMVGQLLSHIPTVAIVGMDGVDYLESWFL